MNKKMTKDNIACKLCGVSDHKLMKVVDEKPEGEMFCDIFPEDYYREIHLFGSCGVYNDHPTVFIQKPIEFLANSAGLTCQKPEIVDDPFGKNTILTFLQPSSE